MSLKNEIINRYDLTVEQVQKFETYLKLLLKWNETHNLTTITDPDHVWVRHFADSLELLPFLPTGTHVIDLGTGAGFPGIPIKILRRDLSVTLVETRGKKAFFCETVIRELKLDDICVVKDRAENAYQELGKFEIVVSRATWSLRDFVTIAKSYKVDQGVIIAMKGKGYLAEMAEAYPVIQELGFKIEKNITYQLPGEPVSHLTIIK